MWGHPRGGPTPITHQKTEGHPDTPPDYTKGDVYTVELDNTPIYICIAGIDQAKVPFAFAFTFNPTAETRGQDSVWSGFTGVTKILDGTWKKIDADPALRTKQWELPAATRDIPFGKKPHLVHIDPETFETHDVGRIEPDDIPSYHTEDVLSGAVAFEYKIKRALRNGASSS